MQGQTFCRTLKTDRETIVVIDVVTDTVKDVKMYSIIEVLTDVT